MRIYCKGENDIDVYLMIEKDSNELRKFKEEVLKNKNIELYSLTTNSQSTFKKFDKEDYLDFRYLNYQNKNLDNGSNYGEFSRLSCDNCITDPKEHFVLKEYIADKHSIKIMPKRIHGDYRPYYLLETPYKSLFDIKERKVYVIRDLINLPKQLYLLHLLYNEKFGELVDEDIESQLKLFEFEFLKSIKLSDIRELIYIGLINDSEHKILKKAEIGNEILKKARVRK